MFPLIFLINTACSPLSLSLSTSILRPLLSLLRRSPSPLIIPATSNQLEPLPLLFTNIVDQPTYSLGNFNPLVHWTPHQPFASIKFLWQAASLAHCPPPLSLRQWRHSNQFIIICNLLFILLLCLIYTLDYVITSRLNFFIFWLNIVF